MASPYNGDDDYLKDEELVDFEGSDYEFASDEELELETKEFAQESQQEAVVQRNLEDLVEAPRDLLTPEALLSTQNELAENKSASLNLDQASLPSNRETESGEIEEERNSKEGVVVFQPTPVSLADDTTREHMQMGENVHRKHRNPDLEDGELDESNMIYSFGAEENGKHEVVGHERKRRKDDHLVEWGDEFGGKDFEKVESSILRQHGSQGSHRMLEALSGLSRPGGQGVSVRMMGLSNASLAPGIMGPGRPFVPLGNGSMVRGIGPFGGLAPHSGRPHIEQFFAHEHLWRAHAMHLAQANLACVSRSSLSGPRGARPFLGLDFLGSRSQVLKQFPPQSPDLLSHMKFPGPYESFNRGQRPHLAGTLRSSMGLIDTASSGIGGLSSNSGPGENLKGGRGQGCARGGRGFTGQFAGLANVVKVGKGTHGDEDASCAYQSNAISFEGDKGIGVTENDARFTAEREQKNRIGESENLNSEDTSVTMPSLMVGSNVIRLLQPVQKSRVLTVSGLPQGTPISTIMEAFEKMGKITDFKKSDDEDTFTISYVTENEAVMAKRSLHRSQIAGKQITVEYACKQF